MYFVSNFRFASRYLKDAAVSENLAQKLQPSRPYMVLYGNFNKLPKKVRFFVDENVKVCQPDSVHICDGSEQEIQLLTYMLQRDGMIRPLPKYENW